MTFLDWYCW